MVTLVIFDKKNTKSTIEITLFGMVTLVSRLLLINACTPIEVTLLGTVYDASD